MDHYEELQQPLFDIIQDKKHNSLVANMFVYKVRNGLRDIEDICVAVYKDVYQRLNRYYGGGQDWQYNLHQACLNDDSREAVEKMAQWALEWEELSQYEKEAIRRDRAQPHIARYYAPKPLEGGWNAARSFLPEERR